MQEVLRPLLLRRMKEDVETLPEKEEVIIWVELTRCQRSYYKALYENQIQSLLSHSKNTELPNLRNLAMELRKVCCHPVRARHIFHLIRIAICDDCNMNPALCDAQLRSMRQCMHYLPPHNHIAYHSDMYVHGRFVVDWPSEDACAAWTWRLHALSAWAYGCRSM